MLFLRGTTTDGGQHMISAVDFEDIFGWGPARARTGLPTTQPSAVSSAMPDELSTVEAPAPNYAIREVRPSPEHRDVRSRELASVTG
jgi:hypothetical protein